MQIIDNEISILDLLKPGLTRLPPVLLISRVSTEAVLLLGKDKGGEGESMLGWRERVGCHAGGHARGLV